MIAGYSSYSAPVSIALMGGYMKKRTRGLRRGEQHPKVKLTDHEVELVRQLREAGMSLGMLASKFEAGKTTIVDICAYRTRI